MADARDAELAGPGRQARRSIAEVPWEEYAGVQRLAWEATRALESVVQPSRVFVAALGSDAKLPNTFAHHHLHVVPLLPGGEDRPSRVFSWEPGVYERGANARSLHAHRRVL